MVIKYVSDCNEKKKKLTISIYNPSPCSGKRNLCLILGVFGVRKEF